MTVTPISAHRRPPAKEPARPTDRMPESAARASLMARVCAARILREHHVWEALRFLPDAAGLPEETRLSADLRRLMEKEALASALRLIARSCQPTREFRNLEQQDDCWVATLCIEPGPGNPRRRKPVRATHHDPAAAMLIALVGSAVTARSADVARRRRALARRHKELSND